MPFRIPLIGLFVYAAGTRGIDYGRVTVTACIVAMMSESATSLQVRCWSNIGQVVREAKRMRVTAKTRSQTRTTLTFR
jgi:hypothetical protein